MRFADSELYRFYQQEFSAMTTPKRVYCLVPAKNKKGRDCALICYVQENSDKTLQLMPVARMIDPAHQLDYDVSHVVIDREAA